MVGERLHPSSVVVREASCASGGSQLLGIIPPPTTTLLLLSLLGAVLLYAAHLCSHTSTSDYVPRQGTAWMKDHVQNLSTNVDTLESFTLFCPYVPGHCYYFFSRFVYTEPSNLEKKSCIISFCAYLFGLRTCL